MVVEHDHCGKKKAQPFDFVAGHDERKIKKAHREDRLLILHGEAAFFDLHISVR